MEPGQSCSAARMHWRRWGVLLAVFFSWTTWPRSAEAGEIPAAVERRAGTRPAEKSEEADARAPRDAWDRLTEDAGLKVGAFFLGISLTRIASSQDEAVRTWVQETRPLGATSVVGARSPPFLLGGTAAVLVGWALAAPEEEAARRRWKHLEIFAVSQAVTAGLTDLLKVTTWRRRPDGGNSLSFPSGHTSSAYAWATFVWRRYGWQWGLPAYAFAAFVGFSRIQDDRHWLSDVLAGALLGVSVTYVVDELYGPLD